jgi:exodeoxyribonuclease VII large subunit
LRTRNALGIDKAAIRFLKQRIPGDYLLISAGIAYLSAACIMPEIIDDKKIFTLLEVTGSIQRTLADRYKSSFWVKAEMNKLNYYPHSGHCYPELVEKVDGRVVAQLKSNLWKDDFLRINRNFMDVLHTPLKDGIRMLFCARITFDPVHGLALRITDIDPVFSLGELEREKQASIDILKKEGIFERNKSLRFPLVPKRMAVISVQTSKGYADFLKVIEGNPWGYCFFHVLFPSLLQGDRAVESILYQLGRIRKVAGHFDLVAIIRGGGGDIGLSCFNDQSLARQIALFPLPVLTGIGHATNETVVEMVAYRNAITPTELADFLIQKCHDFSGPVRKAEDLVVSCAERLLSDARQQLQHAVRYFRSLTSNILVRARHDVRQNASDLFRQSNLALLKERQLQASIIYSIQTSTLSFTHARHEDVRHLGLMLRKGFAGLMRGRRNETENAARAVANMHPVNVLKRGYSITRTRGVAITSIEGIAASDVLETTLANGKVTSVVTETKKSPQL